MTLRAGGDGPEETLWVDKYAPRSFLELLSDEAINRAVVKWLKSWDATVFGMGQPPSAAAGAAGRGPAAGQRGKVAVDRRPVQRVLLMGGPPGDHADPPESLVYSECYYSMLHGSAAVLKILFPCPRWKPTSHRQIQVPVCSFRGSGCSSRRGM